MKKEFMSLLITIFSLQMISALSISDTFSNMNPNDVFLISFIVAIFAILHLLVFSRVFDNNSTISVIISGCVTLAAAWGFNSMNFDFSNLFYSIGISESMLYFISISIILMITLYMLIKKKMRYLVFFTGIGLMLSAALSDFWYEENLVFIIGSALFLIGLWRIWKLRESQFSNNQGSRFSNYNPMKSAYRKFKSTKDYWDPRTRRDKKLINRQNRLEKREARKDIKNLRNKFYHDAGYAVGKPIGTVLKHGTNIAKKINNKIEKVKR